MISNNSNLLLLDKSNFKTNKVFPEDFFIPIDKKKTYKKSVVKESLPFIESKENYNEIFMNSTFKGNEKSRNNYSMSNNRDIIPYEEGFHKKNNNGKKFITFTGCDSYNEKDDKFLRETPHFKEIKNYKFEEEKKQIQKRNIVKTILQKKNNITNNNGFLNDYENFFKFELIDKIEFLIKNIPKDSFSETYIKEKLGNIYLNISEIENYILMKKKNKKNLIPRNKSDVFEKNSIMKLDKSKLDENNNNHNSLSIKKHKPYINPQNLKNKFSVTDRIIKKSSSDNYNNIITKLKN